MAHNIRPEIKKVGIVGGGVIGAGWAARFALNGIDVSVYDPDPEIERKTAAVLANARRALTRLFGQALPAEGTVTFAASLADAVRDADFIQESLPEREDLKQSVLAQIDADHAAQIPPAPVDLGEIAADVIAQLAPLALDAGRRLELETEAPVMVAGRREAIAAALRNLIENALRASPKYSCITVRTASDGTLAVRDGGPDPARGATQSGERSSVAAMVVARKVFERDWRFSVRPKAIWFAGQDLPSPALVGLADSLASALLALIGYLAWAHRGRAAVEAAARQHLQDLEQVRHDLQSVMDTVPTLIAYFDRDGINRFANRAYHDWFGRPPGSITGLHVREVLGEALYQQSGPLLADVLAGQDKHGSRAMTARDGSVREVFVHYVPDRGPGGNVRLDQTGKSRFEILVATRV